MFRGGAEASPAPPLPPLAPPLVLLYSIYLVVRNNINLEQFYHPGLFEDSKWNCCYNKVKPSNGCTPSFINTNNKQQQQQQRDGRPPLPPLPSTPTFPNRSDEHELLQKRSASNPSTLSNGAVGTGNRNYRDCNRNYRDCNRNYRVSNRNYRDSNRNYRDSNRNYRDCNRN